MPAVNPRRIQWMQTGSLEDFSGGPNLRDAWSELAANESEDAWNVTFDERGGVTSRLGYVKEGIHTFAGGFVKNLFWSTIANNRITQAGTTIFLGDATISSHIFSTSELVTFAELNQLIVACHPTDGLFTSPEGVIWTAVADVDAPKGTCVCVWQNKLFVGDPSGTLHWSAAGDPTNWVATDFNKIWEKDQQPIVALHIASGQDILGQAGLLVFKQESTYRVDDSTTGSYTTVDATIGAASPLAVTGVGPKVVVLGKHGIYWWADGVVGMQNGTADRFLPLWNSSQLNLSKQALWCAGRKGTRVVFSLTRAGSTANDLSLEYQPDQGWLAPGSNAMSCYAAATGSSDLVYGGAPAVLGQVYRLDQGGTDDGAAIAWRFQTRWVIVAGGFLASIWQARAHVRGAGNFTALIDYATAGQARSFNASAVVTYDSGITYDSGVIYDGFTLQARQLFNSIGKARQVSFLFTGTSSTTVTTPPILSGTVGTIQGAFGLFGIEYSWWWLGFQS